MSIFAVIDPNLPRIYEADVTTPDFVALQLPPDYVDCEYGLSAQTRRTRAVATSTPHNQTGYIIGMLELL